MAAERRELEPGEPLDDRRLSALLRSLPRERARSGFASRVIARLDERPRLRSRAGWLRTAAAAAGFAVLVSGFALYRVAEERRSEQRRIAEVRRALSEIRNEHRALAAEIERLPATDPESDVVYLGGDDQTDYFVDLTRVGDSKITGAVPASLRNHS